MEFRQVRAFLAVAEEGSMTAAARRLHLTQPAVSRQIKALEDELGVELLSRSAHSVSLTPAGEVLAKDGTRWVEMAERMAQRVREVAAGGVLRVAYAPSLAGSLLGLALERFAQRHPKVRVQLFDCTTAEMKAGLQEGRYDLIVAVPGEREAGRIDWEPVLRRPWRLAMPESPGGEAGPVAVESLKGARLLVYQRDDYPDYWQRVRAYFQAQGVAPVVVGEFDGWSSLRMAVEGGLGVALVAEQDAGGGRLVLRELEPPPEPICVAVGTAVGTEPDMACRVLANELKGAARELS
ncbi:LysR family transcriptional regulator [Haloferula helveola]|uniref:LysR family transcriptional regulator n=1 Tax=Haloferula helveola TaxID=490095 RepID=A0ABN6H5E4_9BACT|nr:LysR family transcriptional regulator [Haloferula helveola]